MIRLRFFNLEPAASAEVDGDEFLFEADEVRRLPGKERVAQHRHSQWHLGAAAYMRLEIRQSVECRFQAQGTAENVQGPFAHVAAVDGVLIVDGRPFAMLKGRQWIAMAGAPSWRGFRLCGVPA